MFFLLFVFFLFVGFWGFFFWVCFCGFFFFPFLKNKMVISYSVKFGVGKCNQQCAFFFNLKTVAGLGDCSLDIGMLGMFIAFPKV